MKPVKILITIHLAVFSLLWMGFGVGAFIWITSHMLDERDRLAAANAGQGEPVDLILQDMEHDSESWPSRWDLVFRIDGQDQTVQQPTLDQQVVQALRAQPNVTGYRVDGEIVVGQLGPMWWTPRWLFLGFGSIPLLVWLAWFVSQRRHHRDQAQGREKAEGASHAVEVKVLPDTEPTAESEGAFRVTERADRDRRPVPQTRMLHVAEDGPAVPEAFTVDYLTFDHEPSDDELVALLGDSDHTESVFNHQGDQITARYRKLPMKWITPWLIFTGIVATTLILYINGELDNIAIVMLLILWILIIPMMVGLMWYLNRVFAAKPDHFVLDLARRHLFIPRTGLSIGFDKLIELISLTRWDVRHGYKHVHQIGVLVLKPASGNNESLRWEYHPLLREHVMLFNGDRHFRKIEDWLGLPVRKIQLNLKQSRQLGDGGD